jgi:hypothetical protein
MLVTPTSCNDIKAGLYPGTFEIIENRDLRVLKR